MKQKSKLIWQMLLVLLFDMLLMFGTYVRFQRQDTRENNLYKIQIHRMTEEFLSHYGSLPKEEFERAIRRECMEYQADEEWEIKRLTFCLNAAQPEFLTAEDGMQYQIEPLILNEEIRGYLRFDYVIEKKNTLLFWCEAIILFAGLSMAAFLFYLNKTMLEPFARFSEIPIELSQGNLKGEYTEQRSRYFGRFMWGISMLRDTLLDSKNKEYALLREKKRLLLSLSHDLKIPLSAIKLQAKSIELEIADTKEKQLHAAKMIEEHCEEMERYVEKIMEASKEDIIHIEVQEGEFYLEEFVSQLKKDYEKKCSLRKITFCVGEYENSLLRGDYARCLEAAQNLLENAIKYGDGREISIWFYQEEYCQIIEIFNTGEVLSDAELTHIFDSFYRGSNVKGQEGNGLGLYICKNILMRMGGDVFAKRNENGMSFCMVLELM